MHRATPIDWLPATFAESDELSRLAGAPFDGQPKHQIGGFPSPVQNDDMELEAQLASHGIEDGRNDPRAAAHRAGAKNWRLLLQFDTDDGLGLMWGDVGILYFWAHEEAARKGDFNDVWVSLQCY